MKINPWVLGVLGGLMLTACGENESPRPYGYPRIDLPAKEYKVAEVDPGCPYSFEMNKHAVWEMDMRGECWGNVVYPSLRAKVQLTYKPVKDNLQDLLEEAHGLAYNHTVKADGIQEQLYENRDQKVYGLMYSLRGDAATATQFFVTDSTDNFLRGVVYFYASPNADSLRPANAFMADEVMRMIETTTWNNK